MPLFTCITGDVAAEIALDKPGAFSLTDDKGRNWFCYEEAESNQQDLFTPALIEMMKSQQLAKKQGFSSVGTKQVGKQCEMDQLKDLLSKEVFG